MRVERLPGNPIIRPHMDDRMGANVAGPSLVRVPDWVPDRLGRYYLYFADHKGSYLRMAYADELTGPWAVHRPGVLDVAGSGFVTERPTGLPEATLRRIAASPSDLLAPHVASPDVHVDDDERRFRLYFHGLLPDAGQASRAAVSPDGLRFEVLLDIIARPYLRMFRHGGAHYGIAMPGVLYRSADGLHGFEEGPTLFGPDMRHAAVWARGDELLVVWTRVGDAPEHLLLSRVDLRGDWWGWTASDPVDLLFPDEPYEGGDLPAVPSVRGEVNEAVRQLRDPAIFLEDGRAWLLWACAGEGGIALGVLHDV